MSSLGSFPACSAATRKNMFLFFSVLRLPWVTFLQSSYLPWYWALLVFRAAWKLWLSIFVRPGAYFISCRPFFEVLKSKASALCSFSEIMDCPNYSLPSLCSQQLLLHFPPNKSHDFIYSELLYNWLSKQLPNMFMCGFYYYCYCSENFLVFEHSMKLYSEIFSQNPTKF